MKNMKKLTAVVMILAMVFAMSMTSLAASVTVPAELNGHTFTAYQIFTGTQAESEGPLGDVEWGNGISSEAFLTALKADETVGSTFDGCVTAADVAEVLAGMGDSSAQAKRVARIACTHRTDNGTALTEGTTELTAGYYLIVDTTDVDGDDDAANAALLQVTDNIEITKKTDRPSVEKKVQEDDKYTQDGGYGTGYNDAADYNIGDVVPFKLIGAVPDMSNYDSYQYIFHDSMTDGLTLNAGSVKVYAANDKTGSGRTDVTEQFTVETAAHGLTVSVDDLKSVSGAAAAKYILVEYTAALNANAVIGLNGNTNEVYLEYSNNPEQQGTGQTAVDKVIVFTYELDTSKVDADNTGKTLAGAKFKLHNAADKWAIVDENDRISGWADKEADGSTLTSGDDGMFRVTGLDDGTYYLKETQAPAGYNCLTDEIETVITADTENGQDWTGEAADALLSLDVTADGQAGSSVLADGLVSITVANNSGSKLPETGGRGTVLFYVTGGMLAAGAAALLLRKRRGSGR